LVLLFYALFQDSALFFSSSSSSLSSSFFFFHFYCFNSGNPRDPETKRFSSATRTHFGKQKGTGKERESVCVCVCPFGARVIFFKIERAPLSPTRSLSSFSQFEKKKKANDLHIHYFCARVKPSRTPKPEHLVSSRFLVSFPFPPHASVVVVSLKRNGAILYL
jgi:hypothetical protein